MRPCSALPFPWHVALLLLLVALGLAVSPVLAGEGEAMPMSMPMSMPMGQTSTAAHAMAGHSAAVAVVHAGCEEMGGPMNETTPQATLHCMASCLAATGLALPVLPDAPHPTLHERAPPGARPQSPLLSRSSPLDPPPPRQD